MRKKESHDFEGELRKDFFNEVEKRRIALEQKIDSLINEINGFPEGTVRDAKYHGGYQYFLRTGKEETNGKYISKSRQKLAMELSQKYYDKKLLTEMEKELAALNLYVGKIGKNYIRNTYECLSEGKRAFVNPLQGKDEEYISKWLSVEYPEGYYPPNYPLFYTKKGEKVHSKSEVIIADLLTDYNVPYRYEYPLQLKNGQEKRPDFICLNVRLRKEIWWEHFGLMERTDYAIDSVEKMALYEQNGMVICDNIIYTFETSKTPLNINTIRMNIEKYLL